MTNNQLAENSVNQLLNSVRLARDNAERADNRVDHSFYYALTIALEELQERRKADSEPVGEFYEDGPLNWYQISDGDRVPAHRRIPLYRHPQPAPERDQVRSEHAEWSQATFGNVGPVGPLKHLSKEALEAAAEPGDLSEWADMQFLLWDAQRRAGITDEQITQAMIEKLAVNKQREWPEPKDGEPRLHIKEQPAQVVPEEATPDSIEILASARRRDHAVFQWDEDQRNAAADSWNACRAAMLHAGNSPAQSDCCPAQNCIHSAQGVDRPVAWHHSAKSKEGNHGTCCFSYASSHDFGPRYEKPQSQPHYLPERLDYDRALHFLSTEPRKVTPETVIGGNSPVIPDGYVMVPKEATKEILDEFDSIIDYGAEDSVDAWHRLLAAATQEVKP